MKCIIIGATGVVGRGILHHCLQNDQITHLFVLARRPLTHDLHSHSKITFIQHQDFSYYPPELLQKLSGAQGCIWALGGRVSELGGNYELARKISVDYPVAAAKAFIQHLAPQLPEREKFRFVFCSMRYAEWKQDKWLWFMSDSRRIKGLAEKALMEAEKYSHRFQLWCLRPYGIVPMDATDLRKEISKRINFVSAEQSGAAFANVLLNGHRDRWVEHEEIMKMGI